MRVAFAGALLTLAMLGCGGDSNDPDDGGVEGRWSAEFSRGSSDATLTLTLNESNGDITGSGTLIGVGDAIALDAEGTYNPPNVSITLSAEGFESINFTGSVGEESMKGRLNGSGLVNTAVTFDRH